MKPKIPTRFPAILACGLLFTPVTAATFTWSRGVAGSFSWNNSTGVTAGESAPSATVNGNWGGAAGVAGTVAGTNFPGVAGDVANLSNAAGNNAQTINLDQNVTIGSISNLGSTNGTGIKTIASGGAGSFSLTFDNLAADASITKLATTNTNASIISTAIAINGNGNLVLTNSSTATLTLSGGITSTLASGTQTLTNGAGNNTISGVIGNGASGGTVAVQVNGGNLSLNVANTYTGATNIAVGSTLTLGSTAGALAATSTITNNGTLTINRTNAVVQGTDFSSSAIGGSGVLNATGTGLTLNLNTANSYAGTTTIGAAANNSVVRASASGALGSGGNIQFDGTGNASTARLELSGGTTLSNPTILFPGRNNASAGIQSTSGNNTLSGNINLQGGGSTYTVQSDADQLTLSGGIAAAATGTRTLTVTGAGNGLASGAITNGTGTTALTKSGNGTWTLSNASSTYTGATTVSAGTLLVNGALGNTAVGVTGGTLGGTGTIAGTVSVSGTGSLSAGTSIESLVTGALTMGSGSTLVYEASNNSSTGADLVAVGGTLLLTGVSLDLTGSNLASGSWVLGDKLTLISYLGGGITSGFNGFTDDTSYTFGSNQWLFNYDDTSAGANFLSDASSGTSFVTMTVIPEPTVALLSGLGMLALLRRRRG
jgi:autotransporter-associated beta strand protein